MRTRFTKTRLGVLTLVVALAVPSAALATHVFDDVEHGRFYSQPVEWALANDITTGTSATTFEPEREIIRGESITFDYRMWTNLIEPALDSLATDATALAARVDSLATVHLTIGSGAFDGDPDVVDGCRGDGFGELVAAVAIPEGATITSINALVLNLEPATLLEVHLQRVSPAGTDVVATISAGTTAARTTVTTDLPTPETVDAGEHFNLVYAAGAGSATQQICGAGIVHTLP